jgi:hypothetical protein
MSNRQGPRLFCRLQQSVKPRPAAENDRQPANAKWLMVTALNDANISDHKAIAQTGTLGTMMRS